MELMKNKGMRTLAIALVAASALILTVIIITFTGASKRAEASTTEEADRQTEALPKPNGPADIGFSEESTEAFGETTEKITETEVETIPVPVYELAFTSNGDGTCYVSGLGTYRRNEVEIPTLSPSGDIVTAIGSYAFYNEDALVRISLPSTIRSIGEYAFLGCASLIEITVPSSNTAYKVDDGILYTRDGSTLVLCPAMRGKTTCSIGANVSVIASGAFANVQNLKTVYYSGSPENWTEINIHANNELLSKIRVVCNCKES